MSTVIEIKILNRKQKEVLERQSTTMKWKFIRGTQRKFDQAKERIHKSEDRTKDKCQSEEQGIKGKEKWTESKNYVGHHYKNQHRNFGCPKKDREKTYRTFVNVYYWSSTGIKGT
jgi:hypothetical protein